MGDCRVLLDTPRSGAWNMALDEVFMDRAAATDRPQLRVYGWQEPTVSLGYFQRIDQRESHPPSRACPLVRRPSGGGAIVHDQEITYALAIPGPWRSHQQRELYHRVHQGLVKLFAQLGATASICRGAAKKEPHSEPFLCFLRRMAGDVVIGNFKVVGSAQRRGKGVVIQHGSVLLKASPAAPELPGIEDLSPIRLARDEWAMRVRDAVLQSLNLQPQPVPLHEFESTTAQTIVQQKYGCQAWNARC